MGIKEVLSQKIDKKEIIVGVVGLGYVGLPLAVEKAKAGFKTIGFDVQKEKGCPSGHPFSYIYLQLSSFSACLTASIASFA